jgi:4-amino-4-deoxy-L-arabinose transferase-like glycosyltransferase
LGGFATGLAILTKGPTAFLICMLVLGIYWARYRFKNKGYFKHMVLFALASSIAPLLWFGTELILHGPWFIQEFVAYQIRLFITPDSGHGGFLGYHFVVLLLGCFPVSVFAIPNLWGDRQCEDEVLESNSLNMCKRSDFSTWMQILFWVVLILFTIVRTKIVHYSSLCYFPLTYLGALTIWRALNWNIRPLVVSILLPTIGVMLGLMIAALPWFGMHPEILKSLFHSDAFALANLDAAVSWEWWQGLGGLLLIVGSIVGLIYWRRYQAWTAAQWIFICGGACTALTIINIVPNIESYTQRAVIEFYESKSNEDCFIRPVGFKSYAHLFYAAKRPVTGDPKQDDYEALAHGPNVGKTVYFVAKINNLGELPGLPGCRELYRKNGFVFYQRR